MVHSGRMICKGQKLEDRKLKLDKDIIFYHEGDQIQEQVAWKVVESPP